MSGTIANNFGSFSVVFASGQGATVTDIEGIEYIDFVSGIGVNCLGHNHPALGDALKKQIERQIHVSNYYNSDIGLSYAKALLHTTGFARLFFANSGAEANEAAIKLARKYGWITGGSEKKDIVTLENSFHGRSLATLAATGQDRFHPDYFAPYPLGFRTIKANDYIALNTAFDENVCALMIECVQGEGGVNLVDAEWAKAAARAARKVGAVVIADEVQTGIGRTGTFLASEQLGFMPEIVTLAKGIAGGVPMGACLYAEKLENTFVAGDHQSTFGGNPLACAGATVVLTELLRPGFLQRVIDTGEFIRSTLQNWNLSCIKNIRGKGLMIGIDIIQSSADIQRECLKEGVCISTAGQNTLRFLPPLVITDKEIEKGLAIVKSVLEKTVK